MNSSIVSCNNCGQKNRVSADKQHLGPKCASCKQPLPMNTAAVPVELDSGSFDPLLSGTDLPVLVDFYSPTCGPCAEMATVVSRLARRYAGRAIIAKLNATAHPRIAMRYQIRGVPVLIVFKGGKPVNRLMGAQPEGAVINAMESVI